MLGGRLGRSGGWRGDGGRWLERLRIVRAADVEPAAWWEQIYTASWETRTLAAHCLALARSEHHARTHDVWDEADIAWLWQLIAGAGYVPRPWERRRLAEATVLGAPVQRRARHEATLIDRPDQPA